MVAEDVATNRFGRGIATRFPPEPNGFPHIGHVKAICVNFGVAREFGGRCNLRFDDTNPATEDVKYVDAFKNDIRWLGFEWDEELYASDYFEQLYQFGELLVKKGSAYVDSQSDVEIRETRGTVTTPGTNSPHRNRSVEENLDLLRRMKAGEFPDGAHVLRGKIDMAHPNMLMRDPILLRIKHAHHYRQGDAWCIYPLYDFAHPLSDAIENITHSLCSLEFKDNNDIYKWLVRECGFEHPPEQTEFSRLSLEYTVMSKRKLLRLVNDGIVTGWDDPRMPTISGLRRRGVTPEGLRAFVETAGVTRKPQRTELATLEAAVRDDLNMRVPRVMCVVNPLKVVITNYPEGQIEGLDASYYPHDVPKTGSRTIPFSRELYIERDDFMEDPAEEILPAGAGAGGSPALRLLHDVHRRHQGRVGRRRRAALHVRSGDERRRRAGRPQGAGDDPLGVGRARARLRASSVRQAVHRAQSGRRRGRQGFSQRREPRVARRRSRGQDRAERGAGSVRVALSVRANGLLRDGPRFVGRRAGVQSDGHAARFLGEDQSEVAGYWHNL